MVTKFLKTHDIYICFNREHPSYESAHELTFPLPSDIMPPQANSPTRRSYPERRRERPCDASTTCQRVVIIRGKLKRCQVRQTAFACVREMRGLQLQRWIALSARLKGQFLFLKEFPQ